MANISNTMEAGILHAHISDYKGIYTSLSKDNVLISKINFSKRHISINLHLAYQIFSSQRNMGLCALFT